MIGRSIVTVAAIDCALVEAMWDFAARDADRIERHWQARVAATPELFNGRVLMLHDGAVVGHGPDAIFKGACFATDFKAFMAWREFGFPSTGVRNIFSMAALETADGAFVLGEMAAHTAPAGQIYFPSGTPDNSDVHGGRVDIEGSAAREMAEETGLTPADVELLPGLDLVLDPVRVCCMKRVRTAETADRLVDRIHRWLDADPDAELTHMHIVRNADGILPAVPDFVADYLRNRLSER